LFDKLDYGDTQIIYSTHSTQISEVSNVENINILAKKSNYAEVYQPSVGLPHESINEIQRYLDAVRTNLLFAKGVLLVEGDAEEILIPIMLKQVYGVSLDELGISLINIRSTGFENVAQLFHDDRIRRKCSIITDLDDAICDTTIVDGDAEKVIKYKKRVEKSKKSGLERKAKLDKFVKDNNWLDVFYANYTFEVDFVLNSNAWEVVEVIKQVYTDDDTQKLSKKELESKDIALFGKRILTMAKQEGKGWFAIMLGEHIFYRTYIPEYIINAIVFAKDSYSIEIISNIVKYRIKKNIEDDKEKKLDFSSCIETLEEYRKNSKSLIDLILQLEKVIPDDQLLTLLRKL
jgi:predicted ATP-dependent endonuclease of OLD family